MDMENIIKRNIEKHINDYQIIINPCPMCNHYNKENYAEICSSCSYFYASNFELKHSNKFLKEEN